MFEFTLLVYERSRVSAENVFISHGGERAKCAAKKVQIYADMWYLPISAGDFRFQADTPDQKFVPPDFQKNLNNFFCFCLENIVNTVI